MFDEDFYHLFDELDSDQANQLIDGFYAVKAILPFGPLLRLPSQNIESVLIGMYKSGESFAAATPAILALTSYENGVRFRGKISNNTLFSDAVLLN
jgi:hypothetical protein